MPEKIEKIVPPWIHKSFVYLNLGLFVFLGIREGIKFSKIEKEHKNVSFSEQIRGQQSQTQTEFVLQAGEEKPTVFSGPGISFLIWANKSFIVISFNPDGTKKDFVMPAGQSSWNGGGNYGLLRLKGIENETIVRFQRVR